MAQGRWEQNHSLPVRLILILAIFGAISCIVGFTFWQQRTTQEHARIAQIIEHPEAPELQLQHTLPIDAGLADVIVFSPDSQLLASAAAYVQLWQVSDGRMLRFFPDSRGIVNTIAFSPDGQMIAAGFSSGGTYNETVALWNVRDGQRRQTLIERPKTKIVSLAFSPDGQLLATAGEDHTVQIWRLRDGQLLQTLTNAPPPTPLPGPGECIDKPCVVTADDEAIRSIAFHPDGQSLAVGSWNGKIRFWQIDDGQLRLTIDAKASSNIAFSPSGEILAVGDGEAVRIYRASDGQQMRLLSFHQATPSRTSLVPWSIAFSPDGQELVVGSYYFYSNSSPNPFVTNPERPALPPNESTLHMIRVSDGHILTHISMYPASLVSVAFSRDKQHIAATDQYHIHVWRPSVP